MSLISWKDQYYKVPADQLVAAAADDVVLVEHALTKFEGLKPENLKRHGMEQSHRQIQEIGDPDTALDITSDTCALCGVYNDRQRGSQSCAECPLKLARGTRCDAERVDEEASPYHTWAAYGNPQPMIDWLRISRPEPEAKTET